MIHPLKNLPTFCLPLPFTDTSLGIWTPFILGMQLSCSLSPLPPTPSHPPSFPFQLDPMLLNATLHKLFASGGPAAGPCRWENLIPTQVLCVYSCERKLLTSQDERGPMLLSCHQWPLYIFKEWCNLGVQHWPLLLAGWTLVVGVNRLALVTQNPCCWTQV